MAIKGVHQEKIPEDPALASTLQTDHMERYRAVPNTVMINQWKNELRWIIIDATYPAQISRRYALLLTRYHMVLDRLQDENVYLAEKELRDTVLNYVLATYPDYFKRDGDFILSPLTGLAIDLGFVKLPLSSTVVFGIKTYLWKLSELVQNAAALNALLIANDNLPPRMVEYKGKELQTFRQFLERYRPRSIQS